MLTFGSVEGGDYLPSSCKITLLQSDVGKWKNVTVQVKCDNTNQPAPNAAFTFSVTDFHDFWAGYVLPPVVVSLIQSLSHLDKKRMRSLHKYMCT